MSDTTARLYQILDYATAATYTTDFVAHIHIDVATWFIYLILIKHHSIFLFANVKLAAILSHRLSQTSCILLDFEFLIDNLLGHPLK